jgi:cell division protein FtsW
MGVTTGMLPTKGLPLPFISWGGTSLLVFMTMMGVVINVALQAERPNRSRALMVVPA